MTYDQALDHFKTQERLAAALGLTQPTVSCWGRVIPPRYQYQLEIITAGALRIDDVLRGPRNGNGREQHA